MKEDKAKLISDNAQLKADIKRTNGDLLEANSKIKQMDEVLRLKEQGDGSILKAVSDSVIKRWEHDYMPDYMRSRDI